MLSLIVFLPLACALLVLLAGGRGDNHEREPLVRTLAVAVSLVTFAATLLLWWRFDPTVAAYQFEEKHAWIPVFGIQYYLGVDGISLLLIVLTGFLTPLALLCSWESVHKNVKVFSFFILALETAMLGVLIFLAATLAFLPLSDFTIPALTVFGVTLACAGIGFLDDSLKLRRQHSLGLRGRWKMLLLILVTVAVGVAANHQHLSHSVFVPVGDWSIPLGPFWYLLLFLIIAGSVNGVNLTDGVDGLAAGTSIIALATFTAMAVTIFIRSATPKHGRIENRLDIAFIGAALIGAAVGFLWFNAFPAELFMGDTGAMALGGGMAAMAIMLKVELLLLFVGGIFAVVALSVVLQVLSFKYWGRRIFLIAPLQHHFEMKAWSETKIMVRFWIVTAIFCAAGFALFYKYYLPFRAHS